MWPRPMGTRYLAAARRSLRHFRSKPMKGPIGPARISYGNRPWVAYDPVMTSQKAIASLAPSSWVVRSADTFRTEKRQLPIGSCIARLTACRIFRTQNFVTPVRGGVG